MKLGLKFSLQHVTGENLRFARQLGVTHIVIHGPRLGENGIFEFDQLLRLRKFIESQGLEAIRAYKEAGVEGVITPDHAPRVEGETGYGYRGRAFALGYIKALMHAAGVR